LANWGQARSPQEQAVQTSGWASGWPGRTGRALCMKAARRVVQADLEVDPDQAAGATVGVGVADRHHVQDLAQPAGGLGDLGWRAVQPRRALI
jgi:hypothetical protein